MPEQILATRPAKDSDFQYVWSVYSEAVKPHIEPKLKDGWRDAAEIERFRKTWKASDSHIITLNDAPIGWGAAVILENEVRLDHLYIEPDHRGKGYGTRLVSELTKLWSRQGKTVYAPVLRQKRVMEAISRLGFEEYGEDKNPLTQMFAYQKK